MNESRARDIVKEASKLAMSKRLDEAEAVLSPLREALPDHVPGLDLEGFIRYFQGRYAEGEALCRRAVELAPERAYGHKGLGLHLAKLGRLEEGLESLQRAIDLSPGWMDPQWDRAIALHEGGRHREAMTRLDEMKRAFPAQGSRIAALRRRVQKVAAAEYLDSL